DIDRSPQDVFCDPFGQSGVMIAGGLKHPNLPALAPFHHPSLARPFCGDCQKANASGRKPSVSALQCNNTRCQRLQQRAAAVFTRGLPPCGSSGFRPAAHRVSGPAHQSAQSSSPPTISPPLIPRSRLRRVARSSPRMRAAAVRFCWVSRMTVGSRAVSRC
ncbi:MAG: hypothetical protein RLZZ436_960, partial [Planctomycetota bacterium]